MPRPINLSGLLQAYSELGRSNALIAQRKEEEKERQRQKRAENKAKHAQQMQTLGSLAGMAVGGAAGAAAGGSAFAGASLGGSIGAQAGNMAGGKPVNPLAVAQIGLQAGGMHEAAKARQKKEMLEKDAQALQLEDSKTLNEQQRAKVAEQNSAKNMAAAIGLFRQQNQTANSKSQMLQAYETEVDKRRITKDSPTYVNMFQTQGQGAIDKHNALQDKKLADGRAVSDTMGVKNYGIALSQLMGKSPAQTEKDRQDFIDGKFIGQLGQPGIRDMQDAVNMTGIQMEHASPQTRLAMQKHFLSVKKARTKADFEKINDTLMGHHKNKMTTSATQINAPLDGKIAKFEEQWADVPKSLKTHKDMVSFRSDMLAGFEKQDNQFRVNENELNKETWDTMVRNNRRMNKASGDDLAAMFGAMTGAKGIPEDKQTRQFMFDALEIPIGTSDADAKAMVDKAWLETKYAVALNHANGTSYGNGTTAHNFFKRRSNELGEKMNRLYPANVTQADEKKKVDPAVAFKGTIWEPRAMPTPTDINNAPDPANSAVKRKEQIDKFIQDDLLSSGGRPGGHKRLLKNPEYVSLRTIDNKTKELEDLQNSSFLGVAFRNLDFQAGPKKILKLEKELETLHANHKKRWGTPAEEEEEEHDRTGFNIAFGG